MELLNNKCSSIRGQACVDDLRRGITAGCLCYRDSSMRLLLSPRHSHNCHEICKFSRVAHFTHILFNFVLVLLMLFFVISLRYKTWPFGTSTHSSLEECQLLLKWWMTGSNPHPNSSVYTTMYFLIDLAYANLLIISNTRSRSHDVLSNLLHVICRLNVLSKWNRQGCIMTFGKALPKTVLSFMSWSVITMATLTHIGLCFLKGSAIAVIPSSVFRLVTQHEIISLCPWQLLEINITSSFQHLGRRCLSMFDHCQRRLPLWNL